MFSSSYLSVAQTSDGKTFRQVKSELDLTPEIHSHFQDQIRLPELNTAGLGGFLHEHAMF